MFKTSKLINQLHVPANDSLTPIRDYANDYFHSNDDKLPTFQRVQSHSTRFRISNPYRHMSNISNKRPASLDLSGIDENITRPAKKMTPSPLNMNLFDKIISLKTPTNSSQLNQSKSPTSPMGSNHDERDEANFFQIIRQLYDSEIKYIETMQMATCVYRKSLHNHSSFKNKIIKPKSSDEILLFGNIDTITSISKIFVASLTKIVTANNNSYNHLDNQFWNRLLEDGELLETLYDSLDIGNLFEQHLHRIKTTYLNYFVTEKKQIQLYESLKTNNSHVFQKWSEYCLKICQFTQLEDILKRPKQRLNEWIQLLESLVDIGGIETVLSEELINKINQTLINYKDFSCQIETETLEYNGLNNKNYDYSLTPMEIIHSYEHSHGIDTDDVEDSRDSRSVTSAGSTTSSYYSRHPTNTSITQPLEINKSQVPHEVDNKIGVSDYRGTLPENIVKFKRIFRDLNKLRNLFCQMDFLSLIDSNINNVKKWIDLENCDQIIGNDTDVNWPQCDFKNKLLLPMSLEYLDELNKIKEKITILKLTEFEVGIMIPLNQLLKASCKIRHNLKDLKTLKKDYIIYLKEKKTNVYDVKRDVIGKHYEQLQSTIDGDLPIFINLVNQLVELIILNYNKLMMKFFETMAGGTKYLQKDIALSSSHTGSSLHLDILQHYSDSRHYTKKLVRDDWQFPCDTSASKPLRKLFEL
ncbi:nuclear fusion protein Fus2p [Monosporozyma unispora]|nr:hypothetical protein C6P44_002081 [Kazachstania unispora]